MDQNLTAGSVANVSVSLPNLSVALLNATSGIVASGQGILTINPDTTLQINGNKLGINMIVLAANTISKITTPDTNTNIGNVSFTSADASVAITSVGNVINFKSQGGSTATSTTIAGSSMKGSGGVATALVFTSGSLTVTVSVFDLRSNTTLAWIFNTPQSYLSTDTVQVTGVMTVLGCSALTSNITNNGNYALYAVGANSSVLIDSGTFSFPLTGGQSTTYAIQCNAVKAGISASQFILQISNTTGPTVNGQVGLSQIVLSAIKS